MEHIYRHELYFNDLTMELPQFMLDFEELLVVLKTELHNASNNTWVFENLFTTVRIAFPMKLDAFTSGFHFFCFLSRGHSLLLTVITMTDEELLLCTEKLVSKAKRRFTFIIFSLIFFKSNKRSNQLKALYFLLHYRGLSYSGFNILYELGLFVSPRTLATHFNDITQLYLVPTADLEVHWYDNMVIDLKGGFVPDKTQNLTVYGATQIPMVEAPKYNGFETIGDFIEEESIEQLVNSFGQQTNLYDYTQLLTYTHLTNPLRAEDSSHYKFKEKDVLDITCGSNAGTA